MRLLFAVNLVLTLNLFLTVNIPLSWADSRVSIGVWGDTYIDGSPQGKNTNYGNSFTIKILDALNDRHGLLIIDSASVRNAVGAGATFNACSLYLWVASVATGGDVDLNIGMKPTHEDSATWLDWQLTSYEWGAEGASQTGSYYNEEDGSGPDRLASSEDSENITSSGVWAKWQIGTQHLDSLMADNYRKLLLVLLPASADVTLELEAEERENLPDRPPEFIIRYDPGEEEGNYRRRRLLELGSKLRAVNCWANQDRRLEI